MMKIQCDVCGKDEAAVFCTADEAALCVGCDHRVHHANKLASKHRRFSLLSPSSNNFPICDVCQEKRAFLFCQQDRAILCRECDIPIHTANEHTQKHNRFLLTGAKLSATSALYASSAAQPPATSGAFDTVPDLGAEASSAVKLPPPPPKSTKTAGSVACSAAIPTNKEGNSSLPAAATNHGNPGSTSSISEYLIEMLPGWHFEDFLDSCSASFGFCKSVGDDHQGGLLPLMDGDDMMSSSSLSSESLRIWVPQAPTPTSSAVANHHFSGGVMKQQVNSSNNKRWSDDIFAVPQISPPSSGLKRSRHFY